MKRSAPLWIVPFLACGSGGDGTAPSQGPALALGQGRLALEIAAESPDADGRASGGKPAQVLAGLQEIIVDIDEVTAHSSESGWVVLLREPRTVDILKLAESAVELGFADLPAGRINQIRLHVAEDSNPYVTLADGSAAPLDVPSGMQSGIKLKGSWNLEACQITRVRARLDRRNSIHVVRTGHSDRHILRPVIFADGASYEDAVCGDGTTPPGEGTTPPGDELPDPGSESPDPGSQTPTPPGEGTPSGDDPAAGGGEEGAPGGETEPGDDTPTGSTGEAPTDPTGGASSPEDGLCDAAQDCLAGYTCGQTGVCIPSF